MHADKPSGDSSMSSIDVAADCKRFVMLASPARWGDNVKARIANAARVLGIKPRRAKAMYYLEAKVITAQEYFALKAKVDEIQERAQVVRGHHDYLRSIADADIELAGTCRRDTSRSDQAEVPAGDDAAAGRA